MKSERILIIEDQKPDADVLISQLRRLGFSNFKHCYTAFAAISYINKEEFDVAVIDKELEDSNINGIELAKIIRDNTSTPFIFVTGYSDEETIEEIRQAGALGHVVKPSSPYQLKVALYNALANRPSEFQESIILKKIADKTIFFDLRNRASQGLRYSSIQFIVWSGRIGRIYLSDDVQFEIHKTSGETFSTYLNEELFIQVNKGTIVNILNIEQIKKGEITFKGITKLNSIKIGKTYTKKLRLAIKKHNLKVIKSF